MASTRTNSYAKIVENGTLAAQEIEHLHQSGYTTNQIYVLAHDSDKTSKIAEVASSNQVGIREEGLFGSMANLLRSRGDELRAKIVSLGFTEAEAAFYEKQLDLGKVLIVAVGSDS